MNQDPVISKWIYDANSDADVTETSSAPVTVISPEAQELLRTACSTDGQIFMVRFLGGQHLQAGDRQFIEDRNFRSAAIWEGVLDELERQGFIKAAGHKREIFRVTREGYDFFDSTLKKHS
jgi:hypothetical protein